MPAVANGRLQKLTGGIMARTLAALVATLVAALTLIDAPVLAEPQAGASAAVGQPLNIIPSLGQARKVHHTADRAAEHPAAAKPPQHVAHRRAVHTAGAAAHGHDG